MEFLIELVLTLFAEIIGAGIEAGIEAGKSRKKKKRISKRITFIKDCENESKKLFFKKQLVIKFEKKRRILVLAACFVVVMLSFSGFAFSVSAWQAGASAALPIATGIGSFIFLIAAVLITVWMFAYKIIFDEEKFTIISKVLPKRIIMHKDLDDVTLDKKYNDAVIIKFYIKGKKRIRFVSDNIDYDKIKKALDEFNSAKNIHNNK